MVLEVPAYQISPPSGSCTLICGGGVERFISELLFLELDKGICLGNTFMKNTVINIVTNRYNLFIRIDSSQQLEVDIPQNSFGLEMDYEFY